MENPTLALPNNGVTRMPIAAQQREADEIAEQIQKLRQKLERLEKTHTKRLHWIELAR